MITQEIWCLNLTLMLQTNLLCIKIMDMRLSYNCMKTENGWKRNTLTCRGSRYYIMAEDMLLSGTAMTMQETVFQNYIMT